MSDCQDFIMQKGHPRPINGAFVKVEPPMVDGFAPDGILMSLLGSHWEFVEHSSQDDEVSLFGNGPLNSWILLFGASSAIMSNSADSSQGGLYLADDGSVGRGKREFEGHVIVKLFRTGRLLMVNPEVALSIKKSSEPVPKAPRKRLQDSLSLGLALSSTFKLRSPALLSHAYLSLVSSAFHAPRLFAIAGSSALSKISQRFQNFAMRAMLSLHGSLPFRAVPPAVSSARGRFHVSLLSHMEAA